VCVEGFLSGRIRFTHIVDTVARVIEELQAPTGKMTVDDVLSADRWARERARQLVPDELSGTTTKAARGTH
jgi:1-deoxy-D-xylulose-5-phosphate reductoisomerase